MWQCLWVLKNFPVILLENDGGNSGGGGGVEVPVREDIRVERSVWEKMKKKEKRMEMSEPAKDGR